MAKLPAGLSAADLEADLGITGAKLPAGDLLEAAGGVHVVAMVPEPASLALAGFGVLGLLRLRRRK